MDAVAMIRRFEPYSRAPVLYFSPTTATTARSLIHFEVEGYDTATNLSRYDHGFRCIDSRLLIAYRLEIRPAEASGGDRTDGIMLEFIDPATEIRFKMRIDGQISLNIRPGVTNGQPGPSPAGRVGR
jgi:hypothetical protein